MWVTARSLAAKLGGSSCRAGGHHVSYLASATNRRARTTRMISGKATTILVASLESSTSSSNNRKEEESGKKKKTKTTSNKSKNKINIKRSSGAGGGRRKRLDEVCKTLQPQYSRNVLQSWIMQGKVCVDGDVVTKSGFLVSNSNEVTINAKEPKYVCRAGLKMEHALKHFAVDPEQKVVLDAGLSTGGFTDCLLQNGAERVYGVDVGYGQVADKIRTDERVVVMERTNLRHLTSEDLPEKVQLATLDLSFISILKVMDAVCHLLQPGGDLITLIKPQFEAEREEVSRGGVVRSDETHQRITRDITQGIVSRGFEFQKLIESPITGAQSGNKEFLAHFVYKPPS